MMLIEGKIPAFTACPFQSKCEIAQGNQCNHKGEQHNVAFSCAAARWFDLTDRRKNK